MRLGTLIQVRRQLMQDAAGVILELGAAQIEHRPVLRIHDLDAQPLGRDVEQQLILEWLERLALSIACAQLRHQRLELLVVGLARRSCCACLDVRRCLVRPWPAGIAPGCRVRWTAALADLRASSAAAHVDHAGAGAARTHLARRRRLATCPAPCSGS